MREAVQANDSPEQVLPDQHLLKIGRFAELAHVSIKTLRFYDAAALFRPAGIAPSGYRLYLASQLPLLRRIRLLRALGCTVAEIRELNARADDSSTYLLGLARLRRRLAVRLALDEQRLKVLDAFLQSRSAVSGETRGSHISQRRLAAIAVLSVRDRVRSLGLPVQRMFEATERRVARLGLRAPASPFLLLHDMEYRLRHVDVEVCVPVELQTLTACGGHLVRGVTRAACARFDGSYAQAPLLYQRVMEWMGHKGIRISGAVREVYMRYGADQRGYKLPERAVAHREADYRTELQIPFAAATAAASDVFGSLMDEQSSLVVEQLGPEQSSPQQTSPEQTGVVDEQSSLLAPASESGWLARQLPET